MTEVPDQLLQLIAELESAKQAAAAASEQVSVAYIKLLAERRRRLNNALDQLSLGVCEDKNHTFEPISAPGEIGLGIVPVDRMHLWFHSVLPIVVNSDLANDIRREFPGTFNLPRRNDVHFYCPPHAPTTPDSHYTYASDGLPNFKSLIERRGESYLTRLHGLDVTTNVREALASRTYSEEVYCYFGFSPITS